MKYLIMKCDELGDQWECDADRTPICMTDDWEAYFNANNIPYDFEVWERQADNTFKRIKEYYTYMNTGMVFGYCPENNQDPIIIERFPNKTKEDPIPKHILERGKKGYDYEEDCNGGINWWEDDDNLYFYCWYGDNHIYVPY